VDFEGFESAEEVVKFYNSFLRDGVADRERPIYGNSEFAKKELSKKDTSGVYRRLEGSGQGDWALDALEVLERFGDNYEDNPAGSSVDHLAAMTLATVSLAEGGGGEYGFYMDLTQKVAEEERNEPIEIEVGYEDVVTPIGQRYSDEVLERAGLKWRDLAPKNEDERERMVHDAMVSGTIDESKYLIGQAEDPDYRELLEAEKRGKDRETFKKFLKRKAEEK
jgi:hypothetical protein